MFEGLTIFLPDSTNIGSQRSTRVGIWRQRVATFGGKLVEIAPPDGCITHELVDDAWDRHEAAPGTSPQVQHHVVHFSWLPDSLRRGRRLPEADYRLERFRKAVIARGPEDSKALSIKIEVASASGLSVPDVQNMLLYFVATGPKPDWLNVVGKGSGVVVLLFTPGIDWQTLRDERRGALAPLVASVPQQMVLQSSHKNEVPSQTRAELFSVPQSDTPKLGQKRKHPDPNHESSRSEAQTLSYIGELFPLEMYLATERQMKACNYPLPTPAQSADSPQSPQHAQQLPDGFSTTEAVRALLEAQEPDAPEPLPLVAVDCEMVITAQGFELARVTLLDGTNGTLLMDELVIPDNPILNYNTRYSGITASMLEAVTLSVAQARQRVTRFVGPGSILVGHTLENDLKAVKLVHLRCIDTSLLYPHPRVSLSIGQPPSLPPI